jgi:hypothetical protein
VTPVREGVAASMAKHVRMHLEAKPGLDPRPLHHTGEAGSGERRPALGGGRARESRRTTAQELAPFHRHPKAVTVMVMDRTGGPEAPMLASTTERNRTHHVIGTGWLQVVPSHKPRSSA